MTNTILTEISSDLASARDATALAAAIDNRTRQLLDLSHSVIGLVNPHSNTLDLTGTGARLPLDDCILGFLRETLTPRWFDLSACPKYFSCLVRRSAISSLTIVALTTQGTSVGCLFLFHRHSGPLHEDGIHLLEAIAPLLSLAAGNIIASEDRKRKDSERALLLSFSSHLATVSDLNGLRFVISQYLRRLLNTREYAITIKNPDNTYEYFLHDWGTDDRPVLHDLKDMLTSHKCSFRGHSARTTVGGENVLGLKLRAAEEDIGVLWLPPGQTNDRLSTSITAQLAIAISNTMALREIAARTAELNNYKKRAENETPLPGKTPAAIEDQNKLIGTGAAMQRVNLALRQVAPANSSVLILGETGTGKELIAQAIHAGSQRKDKAMIKVNCAALPANLIESELFGHERGSFTGAFERKFGKFELAAESTLFLDEIGELPFDLQVKLLRAIQEKEIERVGGKRTIKVNVRIIAATNRDLQKEVDEGRFRRDLYYRLNVFPIFVPPLRDRLEDIPLLVAHFIQKLRKKTGSKVTSISRQALDGLVRYNWPGNIRELENWIERSLLLADGPVIHTVDIPGSGDGLSGTMEQQRVYKTLDENERDHIIDILKKCDWRVGGSGGAADILNVNKSTLHSRMRKLGIKKIRALRCTDHE